MKKFFSQAKWIWIHNENKPDEYAEFIFEFDGDLTSKYNFLITADSNYNVYLNGKLAGFGQPADYPKYTWNEIYPNKCHYENYRNKNITVQLGLGYKHIAGVVNDNPYHKSVVREKGRDFHLRATEKVVLKERVPVDIIRKDDSWIIDMREETVGFLKEMFQTA